jgi:hypothetical protein
MKLFFITAFVFISTTTTAQSKIIFSSQNYAGLLEGEDGSKFQLQTINGLKYKTWFVGVGTGIDWYYRRSIPAFVSLSKDFFRKGNRNFFVSAGGGFNFPWKADNNYNELGYTVVKSRSGVYYEAGFGYRIGIGKKNDAVLIQLGYSYKHVSEDGKAGYIIFILPETYSVDRFDYHLRRLSLKFGWSF